MARQRYRLSFSTSIGSGALPPDGAVPSPAAANDNSQPGALFAAYGIELPVFQLPRQTLASWSCRPVNGRLIGMVLQMPPLRSGCPEERGLQLSFAFLNPRAGNLHDFVPAWKHRLLYHSAAAVLDGLGKEATRATYHLQRNGFAVLGDLIQLHDDEVLKFGKTSIDTLARIKGRLRAMGLDLHMRIDRGGRPFRYREVD